MLKNFPTQLQRASRWLPITLLPLLPFAAQAQFNYVPGNAVNASTAYTDLAATGTAIATANTDDGNSAAQAIGFTFTYNGTAFTQFVLNTNGLIRLGAAAPSAANLFFCNVAGCSNVAPVSSTDPADINLIIPFNMDLEASTTGTPEYRVATTGTAPNRVATIQWKNVRDKADAGTAGTTQYGNMQFQVKLYETSNNIEFVYGTFTSTAPDAFRFATVGIKGASSASSQTVLANKASSAAPWTNTIFITGNYTTSLHNIRGTVPPDAGRTYRFVQATVTPPTVPANDDPAGAIALPLAPTCTPTNGTNVGATTTTPAGYANPGCGIAINPKDVWYKFTTAASGVGSTVADIQVTGTPAGQVRVFSAASSAGPFTETGCSAGTAVNTAAGPLRVSSLTPGTTYFVFISGYGSGDTQGAFTICAIGVATPPTPTYLTLPYTESFEGPWVDILSLRDIPTASWRNNPVSGDNSWRREDDGFASANWRYVANEAPTTNFPIPPYVIRSSTGAHSARFHTFGSDAGRQGKLDLYANLSGTGSKTLSFDYINPTGADKLEVFVSTDGGATFAATSVLTATTNATFTAKTVPIASTSATTVIRFQATSDFGDDDLGIDNLQLRVITATRNEALAATVELYPNPAHQGFTLRVPAGSLAASSARLLNALGQVVQSRQLSLPAAGGTTAFDVSRLAAGVYSLELKTGTDLVVKRVVVE